MSYSAIYLLKMEMITGKGVCFGFNKSVLGFVIDVANLPQSKFSPDSNSLQLRIHKQDFATFLQWLEQTMGYKKT